MATSAGNKKQSDTPEREAEIAAAKDAVGEAYGQLLEAKKHFRMAAEAAGLDLTKEVMERADVGLTKAEAMTDELGESVKNNPLKSVGLAVAIGFILASLFSRK